MAASIFAALGKMSQLNGRARKVLGKPRTHGQLQPVTVENTELERPIV